MRGRPMRAFSCVQRLAQGALSFNPCSQLEWTRMAASCRAYARTGIPTRRAKHDIIWAGASALRLRVWRCTHRSGVPFQSPVAASTMTGTKPPNSGAGGFVRRPNSFLSFRSCYCIEYYVQRH